MESEEVIRIEGCSCFTKLNALTKQDLVKVQFCLGKVVPLQWGFVAQSVALCFLGKEVRI